jgi:hypothetical protein
MHLKFSTLPKVTYPNVTMKPIKHKKDTNFNHSMTLTNSEKTTKSKRNAFEQVPDNKINVRRGKCSIRKVPATQDSVYTINKIMDDTSATSKSNPIFSSMKVEA